MARSKQPSETPAPTVERLNDDQVAALTFQHRDKYKIALAAKKKADADLKNACKIAKAELGDGAIDDIKNLIALESDDGEKKLSDRVNAILRVARWQGVKIGTQFDMFNSEKSQHYEDGKRSALSGEPRKPPTSLSPGSQAYNDWLLGHADGNTSRNAALAGKAAEPGDGVSRKDWHKQLQQQNKEADALIKGSAIGTAPATHVPA